MKSKHKKETLLEKIIVGVIVTVLGGIALAWYLGGGPGNNNPPPRPTQHDEAQQATQGKG